MTRILGALSERARRLLNRRLSYREVFLTPGGELTTASAYVMRDLARYCGAYRTSFRISQVTRSADPLAMAYAEGRRDVYLRLMQMLKLPEEEFLRSLEDNEQ